MSYLAIEQLENNVPVIQQIRLFKGTNLEAIRLHMVKFGVLTDGIVTLGIYDGVSLLGSMSLSYQEFNTLDLYFHGMIRFLPSTAIALRKNFKDPYMVLDLKITFSDHTNSDEAFLGLVKEPYPTIELYNESSIPDSTTETVRIWHLPYGIEIYSN